MIREKELIGKLQSEYGKYLYHKEPLPKPYFENLYNVRAILLGSNPIPLGEYADLDYVFNLGNNNCRIGKCPIFDNIFINMGAIGLKLSEIYAQNLCKCFLINLSVHDDKWVEIASLWADVIKVELDILFKKEIPVLVTAPWILKALCDNVKEPRYYYIHKKMIEKEENKLNRVLIPFFRQQEFRLNNPEWVEYKNYIEGLLN